MAEPEAVHLTLTGQEPTYPFQGTLEPHPASDIIDIDYFEGLMVRAVAPTWGASWVARYLRAPPHPGRDPFLGALLDLYDDFILPLMS